MRFDESTLSRLKVLSDRRHKRYQSLLREFIVERLYEEEKREGLVGADTDVHRIAPKSRAAGRGRRAAI